ncbi:hypothetical protein DPMN_091258 [Dreissena polymorpha]|uniref:Uncharacterized protein n=1 Tax=Dreissena polymorpha TaxID=45954 RepID=A0A9D4KZQ2_DREPO|nr:hypothetical protein DPMN_091258 [Dreissena polymorpha]
MYWKKKVQQSEKRDNSSSSPIKATSVSAWTTSTLPTISLSNTQQQIHEKTNMVADSRRWKASSVSAAFWTAIKKQTQMSKPASAKHKQHCIC